MALPMTMVSMVRAAMSSMSPLSVAAIWSKAPGAPKNAFKVLPSSSRMVSCTMRSLMSGQFSAETDDQVAWDVEAPGSRLAMKSMTP